MPASARWIAASTPMPGWASRNVSRAVDSLSDFPGPEQSRRRPGRSRPRRRGRRRRRRPSPRRIPSSGRPPRRATRSTSTPRVTIGGTVSMPATSPRSVRTEAASRPVVDPAVLDDVDEAVDMRPLVDAPGDGVEVERIPARVDQFGPSFGRHHIEAGERPMERWIAFFGRTSASSGTDRSMTIPCVTSPAARRTASGVRPARAPSTVMGPPGEVRRVDARRSADRRSARSGRHRPRSSPR